MEGIPPNLSGLAVLNKSFEERDPWTRFLKASLPLLPESVRSDAKLAEMPDKMSLCT